MIIDLGFFGFCLLLSVVIICDAWLYAQGHETLFYKHKTDIEKEIQLAQLGKLKSESQREGTL